MFYVIEDLSFNENSTHNAERINRYIANLNRRINDFDFRIYDEARFNPGLPEFIDVNGEEFYSPLFIPYKICWYVSGNDFCYSDASEDDAYPIATLHFILEKLLSEFNIEINGSVILYTYNPDEAIYYKIHKSQIYKHINKSMYLTKYLKYAHQLFDRVEINDPEFKGVLDKAFSDESYMNYLEEYGVENFTTVLAAYI